MRVGTTVTIKIELDKEVRDGHYEYSDVNHCVKQLATRQQNVTYHLAPQCMIPLLPQQECTPENDLE